MSVTAPGRGRAQWALRTPLASRAGPSANVPMISRAARAGISIRPRGQITLKAIAPNASADGHHNQRVVTAPDHLEKRDSDCTSPLLDVRPVRNSRRSSTSSWGIAANTHAGDQCSGDDQNKEQPWPPVLQAELLHWICFDRVNCARDDF